MFFETSVSCVSDRDFVKYLIWNLAPRRSFTRLLLPSFPFTGMWISQGKESCLSASQTIFSHHRNCRIWKKWSSSAFLGPQWPWSSDPRPHSPRITPLPMSFMQCKGNRVHMHNAGLPLLLQSAPPEPRLCRPLTKWGQKTQAWILPLLQDLPLWGAWGWERQIY